MLHRKMPPQPWRALLEGLDHLATEDVRLDCMGGFVVTQLYGLSRSTADIDVMVIAPQEHQQEFLKVGQEGSALHRRYGVYLDYVTVVHVPENYQGRLTEMFPGAFRHLHILALDPYDLALSKIERNIQRDRDDVKYLARTVPLDLDILRERYQTELRWQLGNPGREDLTLKLWIEMILEGRERSLR